MDNQIMWKTAQELCGIQPGQPLTLNMDYQDLKQGDVGNCWLIAAISSVAEYASHVGDNNEDISSVFLTKYYQPGQPVEVQLYTKDGSNRIVLRVPDKFPTKDGVNPMCAQPKASEDAWVMFLEGAAAMMRSGSYDDLTYDAYETLESGNPLEAFTYLLGPTNFHFLMRGNDGWQCGADNHALSNAQLWQNMMAAHKAGGYLCAGTGDINGDGVDGSDSGIAEKHAWTIRRVDTYNGVNMVHIRNPWGHLGQGEQDLKALGATIHGNGEFELSIDKFAGKFNHVCILGRTGLDELRNWGGTEGQGLQGPATPEPVFRAEAGEVCDDEYQEQEEQDEAATGCEYEEEEEADGEEGCAEAEEEEADEEAEEGDQEQQCQEEEEEEAAEYQEEDGGDGEEEAEPEEVEGCYEEEECGGNEGYGEEVCCYEEDGGEEYEEE